MSDVGGHARGHVAGGRGNWAKTLATSIINFSLPISKASQEKDSH